MRYYTEPDAAKVKEYAPDHIILAAGGRPILPRSIPGLDLPKVYPATEALSCCCDVGDRVLVVGGGLVGVETALQMDMWGKHVTCIDMAKTIPSEPGFKMNDMLMKQYMVKSNVQFMPSTKLVRIDGDDFTCTVTVESEGVQSTVECDTVLLALGFLPTATSDCFSSLCSKARSERRETPVTVIGDSQRPRKIIFAIEDAHNAVRALS